MDKKFKSQRVTIGIVMPMLSGFYMGEISSTFRQLAKRHNVNLVILRAGDCRECRDFVLPVALEQLDALVVVLHSASIHYVQAATDLGIPVFSMGASYAPLPVEPFYSHQNSGVELLYDWLVSQGHKNISFCGDLAVNDVRARFNAFKQCVLKYEERQFHSAQLISVNDCALSGGRQAAKIWLNQTDKLSTAFICATDQNALGMIEQLKVHGVRVPEDVAVVGIDNIFAGLSSQPQLTTADQQLEELSNLVFQRALARIAGAPFDPLGISVNQKLVVRHSCGSTIELAQPEETSSIRHAMLYDDRHSSSELFDNLYSIAKHGFDSVLDASSLYQCNLAWAELSRYEKGYFHTISHVTPTIESHQKSKHHHDLASLPCLPDGEQAYAVCIVPINQGKTGCWDFITTAEVLDQHSDVGSSSLFHNYLDILSLFAERDALIETNQQRHKNAQQLLQQLKVVSSSSNDGIWEWEILTNRLYWNGRLANMLQLSDSETTDVFDPQLFLNRIHHEDLDEFEHTIQHHLDDPAPFKCVVRLRREDGHFIWVQINGSAIRNAKGKPVRLVGSMVDVTEQQESADKIHQMAYFDGLTGVANRRKVVEDIQRHIEENPSQKKAVMMMDLNRFKVINDTFGHQVGDTLLIHVAQELKALVKEGDLLGRFGGDEFIFFCDVNSVEETVKQAKGFLQAVRKPMQHDNIELVSEASLGVTFYPEDAQDADVLIKNADVAMYSAKQMGDGKMALYNEQMDQSFKSHLKIEHLLSLAIDKEEIHVHYQPLFDGNKQKLRSVEVLARWSSPILGNVPPDEFITVAENSALIMRLGDYIVDRVCQDVLASSWLRSLQHISINISARQLVHTHFARHITRKIQNYQLPTSLFCLEVTETAAISNKELCYRTLLELKNAGFTISLDDFGTGFSSLSLLKRLPIKEVKIDRSFINDIAEQSSNLEFIRGLVSMVKSLGYRVVVEGVETQQQADALRQLGIDLMQGYYLARPNNLADIEERFGVLFTKGES